VRRDSTVSVVRHTESREFASSGGCPSARGTGQAAAPRRAATKRLRHRCDPLKARRRLCDRPAQPSQRPRSIPRLRKRGNNTRRRRRQPRDKRYPHQQSGPLPLRSHLIGPAAELPTRARRGGVGGGASLPHPMYRASPAAASGLPLGSPPEGRSPPRTLRAPSAPQTQSPA
jgi:hypothetical protein